MVTPASKIKSKIDFFMFPLTSYIVVMSVYVKNLSRFTIFIPQNSVFFFCYRCSIVEIH